MATTPEEVAKLSTLVFESITACALKQHELNVVRANRSAPSDSIMDAAQAFRAAEARMNESVQALLNAQIKALAAAT